MASLSSLMDGRYYLVYPDGRPAGLDSELGDPYPAYSTNQIHFWNTIKYARRFADDWNDKGFRVMRIRKAWSDKGTFLYSEWVPSDEPSDEAPSAIGVRLVDELFGYHHNLYEG